MRKTNILKYLFPIFVVFIATGCESYYYIPGMHNVPLFDRKNELSIDISGSTATELNGFEFQAAYSMTENFGIALSGLKMNQGEKPENDYLKSFQYEGAIGFFKAYGKDKDIIFETFGGIRYGTLENGYQNNSYSLLDFNQYFIQPAIGYISNNTDVAVSFKISGLRYNNIHYSGNLSSEEVQNVIYISENPFSIIMEPAITLRTGWQHVKFQFQSVFSRNFSYPDIHQKIINLNMGVYFTF